MDSGLAIIEELFKYGPIGLIFAIFLFFMKPELSKLIRPEKNGIVPASKKDLEDLRDEFDEHKLEFTEIKGVLKGKGHI